MPDFSKEWKRFVQCLIKLAMKADSSKALEAWSNCFDEGFAAGKRVRAEVSFNDRLGDKPNFPMEFK